MSEICVSEFLGASLVGLLLLILFNVGFTEMVPIVEGERELISNRHTVTTRIISALRWTSDLSHFNLSLTV